MNYVREFTGRVRGVWCYVTRSTADGGGTTLFRPVFTLTYGALHALQFLGLMHLVETRQLSAEDVTALQETPFGSDHFMHSIGMSLGMALPAFAVAALTSLTCQFVSRHIAPLGAANRRWRVASRDVPRAGPIGAAIGIAYGLLRAPAAWPAILPFAGTVLRQATQGHQPRVISVNYLWLFGFGSLLSYGTIGYAAGRAASAAAYAASSDAPPAQPASPADPPLKPRQP